MKDKSSPILDSTEESLEIIRVFTPEFYSFLKLQPRFIDALLILNRKGNQKAEEIIKYLLTQSPELFTTPVAIELERKAFLEGKVNYVTGHWQYDWEESNPNGNNYIISWSDLKITKRNNQVFINFNCDLFLDYWSWADLWIKRSYLGGEASRSIVIKRVLKPKIIEWLKEKGYKPRRRDRNNNGGPYYSKVSRVLINSIKEEKYDFTKKKFEKARFAKANFLFEIVPL